MNRLGIQVLFALLGVACFVGELCAQRAPTDAPINPPVQPGVAASVPSLPTLSIANIHLPQEQDNLNPPPRGTATVLPPIVTPEQAKEQAKIKQVSYDEVIAPPPSSHPSTYSRANQRPSARKHPSILKVYGEATGAQQGAGLIAEERYTPPSPGFSSGSRQFNSSIPTEVSAFAPAQRRLPANRVRSVSWGYPQDQGQPAPEEFPRTPTPPTTSLAPVFPTVPNNSTPQDPRDPFQQLPGNTNDPTPRPLPRPQTDTEPRPLPNGGLPPTQLPIPPRDRTQTPTEPNQGFQGNGNGNGGQNNGINEVKGINGQGSNEDGLIVYPESVAPGRQSYPGPTSSHEPNLEPGQATVVDTSQIIYGDSRPITQGQGQILGSVLEQNNPNVVSNSPFDIYAPPTASPQIAPVNYESECCEPCGWRPELAIGLDPSSPSFQPAFYLSLFGGLNHIDDLFGNSSIVGGTSSSFSPDDGGGFGFALGQYQGFNLRTEFEYSFRTNDVDQISLAENVGNALTFTDFGLNGELAAHSGMGNIIWQFNGFRSRWIRPYVGAGAGFVFLDANFDRFGQDILANGNDGDSTFAYQLFGGLNVQLNRQMDVFLEYRYFAADSLRLETDFANVNGGVGSVLEDFDYEADNVFFGVRFKF